MYSSSSRLNASYSLSGAQRLLHPDSSAAFPASMRKFRWSLDHIEQMIRDKVTAHTTKATTEKQVFHLFSDSWPVLTALFVCFCAIFNPLSPGFFM
jgi:hypothetical protein